MISGDRHSAPRDGDESEQLVRVLDHPLAAVQLSILRNRETAPQEFRAALRRVALHLGDARGEKQTPLQSFTGSVAGRPVALVPILRAGLGLAEGMVGAHPVGERGTHRPLPRPGNPAPAEVFLAPPGEHRDAQVLVLDPMLATGHNAVERSRS